MFEEGVTAHAPANRAEREAHPGSGSRGSRGRARRLPLGPEVCLQLKRVQLVPLFYIKTQDCGR